LSSPRTKHLRISVGASESSTSVYGEAFFNSLLDETRRTVDLDHSSDGPYGSTSPRFASTQRNHASRQVSTDFCNKICQYATAALKTATLVALELAKFSVTRSRAILALACGYLFSALIVIAHGLAFPGAFSPTGNFDGSRFTTFRIYLFWHLGLPASIFAYVWLREKDRRMVGTRAPTTRVAIYSVASVLALVSCIVWLGTGDELPPWDGLGNDLRVSLWLTILTMLTCATALSVLWRFRLSALDQWLMVVMVALMVELTLTAL
jgi:hypothetical protein